jgi:hypothetical protein
MSGRADSIKFLQAGRWKSGKCKHVLTIWPDITHHNSKTHTFVCMYMHWIKTSLPHLLTRCYAALLQWRSYTCLILGNCSVLSCFSVMQRIIKITYVLFFAWLDSKLQQCLSAWWKRCWMQRQNRYLIVFQLGWAAIELTQLITARHLKWS